MSFYVMGISAFFHDSAVCILRDGQILCAIEEEKLSRIKHDNGFPGHAIDFCLNKAQITVRDLDVVAFYEEPLEKISRQIWMAILPNSALELKKQIINKLESKYFETHLYNILGYTGQVEYCKHHEAHAASSYFFSGFDDSAIMTFDGVGEWATTTYGKSTEGTIELFEEVHFPHSIGLLYSTITAYLGFKVNNGEYKVMGLAPYGRPKFINQIYSLIENQAEGQYALNLEYFSFLETERMYSQKLIDLFGREPRESESSIDDFHNDVAHSLQKVLEDILLKKANYLHSKVPSKNLCMAGGVALNCVANAHILRNSPFEQLFIQPAASDAGGALGAAALISYKHIGKRQPPGKRLDHVYFGSSYTSREIRVFLDATAVKYLDYEDNTEELIRQTVNRLKQGNVIGWYNGAMEYGPRALGNRSIIADPRVKDMRDRINALVKMREAFRPFAPVVLESKAYQHFDIDHPSPFMLETCQVISNLDLPAITHVDNSARIQTINERTNSRFAMLLEQFDSETGCPILLNTSFNVRGEPIVATPEDALMCFARSRIDTLVLQDFIIDRNDIPGHWEVVAEAIPIRKNIEVSEKVYAMI